MAFVFTALSRNKVAFECNAIAVNGLAPQTQSLLTDPLSAILIGGALPPATAGTTTATVQAHLDVNIEEVTNATGAAEDIYEYSADVVSVGGVPSLTCNMFKAAAQTGIIRGTIERVQSRDL